MDVYGGFNMGSIKNLHYLLINNKLPLGTILNREDGSSLVVTMRGIVNCDNRKEVQEELN